MRAFSLLAVALMCGSAVAAEIPVSSPYGTNETACAIYKNGGASAVGGSPNEAMIVSPTEIVFLEGGCTPTAVEGDLVSLTCSGQGEEWTNKAQIIIQGDMLAYGDEDGLAATLYRCPQ